MILKKLHKKLTEITYSNSITKKIILAIFFFIIIAYFVELENLYKELKKINIYTLIISLIFFLPHTYFYILKWYLIVKKFYKKKFSDFLTSMSRAIFLSEITQSGIVLELSKFYYLGDIKRNTKIILIFNDKIISFVVKLFFLLLGFIFFLFLNLDIHFNKQDIYLLSLIPVLSFLIITLFLMQKKILNKLKSFYKKYFSKEIIPRKLVFGLEIIRNLQFLLIYYMSLSNFFDSVTILKFLLFVPIFELLTRLQFFSALGSREVLFLLIGVNLNISNEQLVISSFVITSVTFLTSLLNYFIINILIDFDKQSRLNIKN